METHSRRRLHKLIPLLVLAAAGAMIETQATDFSIFGRHALDVPAGPLAGFEGADVRVLRHDPRGLVAEVRVPIGVTVSAPDGDHTAEVFVLEGQLRLEHDSRREMLAKHDYLHIPAVVRAAALQAIAASTLLVFFDPPRLTDGNTISLVRTTAGDWSAGVVSARDTGIALKLQVRDLYQSPQSGQRTWLLRAGADLTLPWERHRTIEEGYLVSGDYRLFECLAGREQRFDYRSGGYFYRAPGIVHGGPRSGSSGEIVMLLRTPDKLTVEFLATCATPANP
ncbi:MAG: hypothetical protein KJS73_05480 [Gammaproteobacteria bacterium]|nr:hypothetical protein [Gammaproteobacteria bacterium]